MRRYHIISLLFFSQSVFIQSAQAQMYQWTDAETGTTQLSGKPPAWYRSIEGGSRVFVFSRGKIVDDTAIKIFDEQRESLRIKAFVSAEKDRNAAKQKAIEAAKLKAAIKRHSDEEIKEDIDDKALAQEPQIDSSETMAMEEEINEDEASIEKMKMLIAEWENKRTEEAKALLESRNK